MDYMAAEKSEMQSYRVWVFPLVTVLLKLLTPNIDMGKSGAECMGGKNGQLCLIIWS